MVAIKDFASNSVMGVVRKVVNYLCDTLTPKVDGAIDHLPARFNGTFDDSTRNLTMVIESQGTSTENLTAVVNIPGGGGSGGPTYSAGNGINITSTNAIEIDTGVTATKQSVDTLQAQVGDAFTEVAIGADGKSLDFTALDGQVNNIVLPSSEDSGNWEEIDVNNWPNDFESTDIIKIEFKKLNLNITYVSGDKWTNTVYNINSINGEGINPNTVIISLNDNIHPLNYLISYIVTPTECISIAIYTVGSNYAFGSRLFTLRGCYYNGGDCKTTDVHVNTTNLTEYINRIWRKKQ